MSPSLPLAGHLFEFQRDRTHFLQRCYEKHGSIFGIKLGPKPAAVLVGPENSRLFFDETDKKLNMHKSYQFLAANFGEIAFLGPHEVYLNHCPVLHLPFKRSKMVHYIAVMQEEVNLWIDSLLDTVDNTGYGEFELTSHINSVVQRVAAHAFMGKAFHQRMGDEFWAHYTDIGKALDPVLPPNWPLPKFRRRDRARDALRTLLTPLIEERHQSHEEHNDFLQEFLNAQYKDGSTPNTEEILSLLLGLMFAGHETTAGQAAWTVIHLLQHPAYAQKVQEEIGTHLPNDCEITAKEMRQLKHIDWAIRESGRLRPSADLIMRTADEDIVVGDYRIPAGWIVILATSTSHFQPELFESPDLYDPLRFALNRAEDEQHRFAITTFGGGLHKCTGMNFANNEMMIITALLFQRLELELLTPNPGIESSLGANRPTETMIRYRQK